MRKTRKKEICNESKELLNTCIRTLFLMTVIYTGLYALFLVRQYIYIYPLGEIGSDTATTYLPNIVFDIRSILSGNYDVYSLQRGLGEYYENPLYKYVLNFVNLPLLFFGEQRIHWGLLFALYFKYAAISLFAVLFFRHLLRDDRLAMVCALLWTFSGYMVLWGQHYQNLTNSVWFTFAMYGLQLFLEGDRKRFLVIPAMAMLAYSSYLCLYTSCFFFAIYSILYLAFHKVKLSEILKKAALFAGILVVAVCIAGEYILPSVGRFLSSIRASDMSAGDESSSPFFYSIQYLIAFLGRLLSNDALGVGNSYSGPQNYYEIAMLCISTLFLYSAVLMLQSRWKKQVGFLVAGCVAALCIPLTSQILTFSYLRQRWTFVFCFAEVILIGFALRQYFLNYKRPEFQETIHRTILISDSLYLLFILVLWLANESFATGFNTKALLITAICSRVYALLFWLMPKWKVRYCYTVLAVAICGELIAANYDTVNNRQNIAPDRWFLSMYHDGTDDVVEWIAEGDSSLYRINKTYDSVRYNDALVQGFNGMKSYSSTTSADLASLYESSGGEKRNNSYKWINFTADDIIANSLMGVKYIVAKPGDEVDPYYYRTIYSSKDYMVYQNMHCAGFGYLYFDQISGDELSSMSVSQTKLARTTAFYLTDDAERNAVRSGGEVELEGSQTMDLMPSYSDAELCEVEETDVLTVSGYSDDMQVYFTVPEIPEGWILSNVSVTLTAESDSTVQLFIATDGKGYSEKQSYTVEYTAGTATYDLTPVYDGEVTGIRLDPSGICQNVTIDSVCLELQNPEQISKNLRQLKKNAMTDFSQDGNLFSGSIVNPDSDSAMLCIPLVYHENWEATLDGEAVEIKNINGGMLGIEVASGAHEITITYRDNSAQIGRCVGISAALVYLICTAIWWRRRGRFEPRFSLASDGHSNLQ